MDRSLSIILGDANGVDKAVQRILADENYRNVRIYHSGSVCRNNLGNWCTRQIETDCATGNFWFYAAKDIAMSDDADYGLMVWDGESAGTVHNILNLVDKGKPVVVYFAPESRFANLRNPADLESLLERCPGDALRDFDRKLDLAARLHARRGKIGLAQ
ncbi:MAG: hypothetical protein HUU46_19435 [Candidatus Hydrogenedentes bacterium]|nr:hypothetical protein [Candidatus Hydrogenedentota bacterium]